MQPIFLIGYMGCGKSTLGRTVSAMTGMQFIDLDAYIEGRFHMTVRDIFAQRGEQGFRDIERSMLHEVGDLRMCLSLAGAELHAFLTTWNG